MLAAVHCLPALCRLQALSCHQGNFFLFTTLAAALLWSINISTAIPHLAACRFAPTTTSVCAEGTAELFFDDVHHSSGMASACVGDETLISMQSACSQQAMSTADHLQSEALLTSQEGLIKSGASWRQAACCSQCVRRITADDPSHMECTQSKQILGPLADGVTVSINAFQALGRGSIVSESSFYEYPLQRTFAYEAL